MTAETTRFSTQIADALLADIAAGRLRPGDRVPPIRELADQFQVAPQTAKNALTTLRERGLIYAASTRGYFVAEGAADGIDAGAGGADVQELRRELVLLRDEVRRLTERVAALEGTGDPTRGQAGGGPGKDR